MGIEMPVGILITIFILVPVVCGIIGLEIADPIKSPLAGFIFGTIFGPVGWMVIWGVVKIVKASETSPVKNDEAPSPSIRSLVSISEGDLDKAEEKHRTSGFTYTRFEIHNAIRDGKCVACGGDAATTSESEYFAHRKLGLCPGCVKKRSIS